VTGRLLTARELAELLGVSAGALLRWTRRGEVPHVRLPSGAVRYRPDAIAAWLDGREKGATGDQELSTTGAEPRPREPYVRLSSVPSTTRPHETAENQEDHDGRT
jgi:excisionase family DNA binding protein